MKSTQNTLWVAGAGVLAALLVVATYFLVVAPQRTEAADLQTQRVSVEQTNAEIEQRTEQLKSQFATLDDKKQELAAIKSQLPTAADVPALLRQANGYATTAGVRIDQITPGTPESYGTTAADGTTADSSGIVSIPLTIAVSGSLAQVELYVKFLQADMPRHFAITGLTVSTDASANTSNAVSATLSGAIFVLQDSTGTATATSGSGSTDAGTASENSASTTGADTTTGTTTTAMVS